MADSNTGVSRTVVGVSKDLHPMQMAEGNYDYALNASISSPDGNSMLVQNVPSTLLCAGFPTGYFVSGFVNVIEQQRIIWFLSNPETEGSEIGETNDLGSCREYAKNGIVKGLCDDCGSVNLLEGQPLENFTQKSCCTYRQIVNENCLNFTREFPISAVEYRIIDCGIQVFFSDNNNGRRYIIFEYLIDNDPTSGLKIKNQFFEIDHFTDDDCQSPVYSTHLDCNRLSIQPNISSPCIEFVDLASGGNNKAGVYQFFIAFSDVNGNKRSSYVSSTNPIPIKTRDITFETDYVTDRAIYLNIKNLDITGAYQYYNLAVAKTINGFTSFYEVGTFSVTQHSYSYTGNNEAEKKLSAGDIFQTLPFYKNAGSVTSSNNILYWADLEEEASINVQRIANNINLFWQTTAIPESVYRNPRNVNKFRGYQRDEVVPVGIEFLLDKGGKTSVGHIPGREATSTDLEEITNDDAVSEKNCLPCSDVASRDEQLVLDILNTVTCSGTTGGLTLIIDNSFQSSGCPLSSHSEVGCTPVTIDGTPPNISAGGDQTINYLSSVPLTGTAFDGSFPSISVLWTQLSGPNTVTINNVNILNTYFSNYDTGTYIFQLCVTDTAGNISVDTVQYTITIPDNEAPICDPGADKLVLLPDSSTSFLNGSNSSDAEGIASYLWSQVSGPNTAVIDDPNSVYTSISGLIAGTYKFSLIVTDARGCTSESTTFIYVVDLSTEVPGCAELLYPVNGSVVSSTATIVLDWEDVFNANSYDIYVRKDDALFTLRGNTTESNFTITALDPNSIYHWYVIPKNDAGSAINCDNCYKSFSTPALRPVISCNKKRWEVYNTATIEGGDLELYKDCEETCYQYGKFAYWQSSETYPNIPEVWGDLCGQFIRFPKFPDSFVSHIHDNQNGDLDFNRNNIVYPIGIKIDHESVRAAIATAVSESAITQTQADRIVGYRIVRGNRFNNKSIVAKGILFDVNQYQRKLKGSYFDNQPVYFANYPYNDLRNNPFVTDDFRNYENHNTQKGADLPFIFSNRYTFHSPDTHFTEPTIGSKLKLETIEYGLSEGYFTKSKKQAKQRFLSNTAYSIAFTAGIVGALLRTEEKEVKEYTVKGNVISALGVASGTLGPYLPYSVGPGGAVFASESILDTIVNPTRAASINVSTEATTRTIQGKHNDWFNPLFLAVKKPALLPLYPLMLVNYLSGFLTTIIQEAEIIINLIESLTPYREWAVQHNSVGKYNAYKAIANTGNKIRSISSWAYLRGDNTNVSEISEVNPNQYVTVKMNNWNRESSVYVKYDGNQLPNASDVSTIEDQSRFTLEDADCDLDKKLYKPISSYYASIKNYVPDQYGTIYNIEYLPTDSCSFDMNVANDDCRTIFGGDTFINRFALKVKVSYFLATTFGLPAGTDFNYAEYPNLGVPRHYYNSTLGVGSEIDDIGDILSLLTPEGIATFLGRPKSIRDCSSNKFFYQNGYIYLYHYGIPYFLVESDINVDYRHGENLKEKGFYPIQSDLDYWLQEENVPISEDNSYLYNKDYSKQNKEAPFVINGPNFEPNKKCLVSHPNRIIYSSDKDGLIYRANDFFDFPLSNGTITSIEGIENETVLVRTTNSTSVFKSVLRTMVDGQTVQTGNAGIFANPPQEFAVTSLGFIGSQHKAILHTEFGHIYPDAKRGQIFNIQSGGNGLDILSNYGMKNWFKENLPFQILRDFPNMPETDIDNNFLGIGITMSFDKKNNRLFITKLDYKIKDKNITYDPSTKKFKRNEDTIVRVGDKRYFTNKCWTWSYSFESKSWTSPFTWNPNYYIDSIDYFGSGKDSGFWLHNLTNNSYQVFYGKLEPFIFEPILKFDVELKQLNSIKFDTEVRRYSNEFDYTIKKGIPGINKAIVYNDIYNSGLLNLVKSDKNDLSSVGKYPIRNTNSWEIETSISNYKWNFNQFYNLVKDNSEIPLWLYKGNNVEKSLNDLAFNYRKADFTLPRLKGQWFKVMLINDKISNYKIIHKFTLDEQTKQYK